MGSSYNLISRKTPSLPQEDRNSAQMLLKGTLFNPTITENVHLHNVQLGKSASLPVLSFVNCNYVVCLI